MRILHTADWHLGKKLYQIDRMVEQREVLNEICQIADEQQVDVVLIAGDLYDVINPGSEANELFYKTLHRLSKNGKRPVLAIAGNHDSADRIAAPDPLAKVSGILLFGHVETDMGTAEMEGGWKISKSAPGFVEITMPGRYPLRVLCTPYISELRVGKYMGHEEEAGLRDYVCEHWQKLADTFCDPHGYNVLMTHLYMWPAGEKPKEEPEGEKPIKIGNSSIIYTHLVPDNIQYVALGHLHRSQKLSGSSVDIRYCGSPLAYSFSEAGQTKYVHIVDLEPGKKAQVERIALTKGYPVLRKSFENLQEAHAWIQQNQDAHIEVTVFTNQALSAQEVRSLQNAGNQLVQIIPRTKNAEIESKSQDFHEEKSLREVFRDYYASVENVEPNEEMMNLLNEILAQTSHDA